MRSSSADMMAMGGSRWELLMSRKVAGGAKKMRVESVERKF